MAGNSLPRHRIVVSAENNAYTAWQAKLLHYSCASRLGRLPVVFVHGDGGDLHADFLEIARAGGHVVRAPSYKVTRHGDAYAPRNTPGTLREASRRLRDRCDFFVLCDPDMAFVRPPDFPEALSGDRYSYLNYSEEYVRDAGSRIGVATRAIERAKERLRCGVPHVVPAAMAAELADAWLEAVDAFTPRRWTDSMYAFGLAALKIGAEVAVTRSVAPNSQSKLPPGASVIHYYALDDAWDKRSYTSDVEIRQLWERRPQAPRGSTLEELLRQIGEAGEFYRALSGGPIDTGDRRG
jgi:hypothetical protein